MATKPFPCSSNSKDSRSLTRAGHRTVHHGSSMGRKTPPAGGHKSYTPAGKGGGVVKGKK